ncbi:DNA replication and repair protein RecO [Thermosporothrix hazakensis]|jgi:DNA repair protein RecO (recombination protein O)|uniref:DNA repair protein RecO n=1 Tax=Thermosporothrix hazakensis TaxID=644383 RepID=A0A326UE76_THEHA|nr:DNA repair protein RecO [Thermosporothrix hazakensis]PZW36788.1 DNA replication and repair protein RecO [Thermosporothrix hazakensis]GCE47437.1 DNA repair protein RecO [Thermosporothrix hazakensis]
MAQPRTYSTNAIILKRFPYGEADRILTLFTPYKGKISAIAKGTRRPVSRKSGHLELLCLSRLHVAQGRNLDIITQAQVSESFLHLRGEFWHMTCSTYLAELIDRLIEDDNPYPEVYELLTLALRVLDADAQELQQQRTAGTLNAAHERDRSLLLLRFFEIHLLSLIGYEPLLRTCAHCDAELEPVENGFTPTLGGALCPECSHLWSHKISVNALKVLRLLQRSSWAQVPRLHLNEQLHGEIEHAVRGLLRQHLERDPESWEFLAMSTRH